MVEKACRIPIDIAIKVFVLVEAEYIHVIPLATTGGLLLVDPFSQVFDNPDAFCNISTREATNFVDGRLLEDNPFVCGRASCWFVLGVYGRHTVKVYRIHRTSV